MSKTGYLHSDDGVYEEKHSDQETDVGQCLWAERKQKTAGEHVCRKDKGRSKRCENMSDLEGLYEGPQQDTNSVTLSQQLDQPGCSEEFQETHVNGVHRLDGMVGQ